MMERRVNSRIVSSSNGVDAFTISRHAILSSATFIFVARESKVLFSLQFI